MLHTLRRTAASLRRVLKPERPYRPDWSGATLARALAGHPDPDVVALVAGDPDVAALAQRLCQHFRQRAQPLFFASGADLALLAAANPFAGIDSSADADRPYLRNGFAATAAQGWASPPAGPGNDDLYAVRPHRFAGAPRLALRSLQDSGCADELAAALRGWMRLAQAGRSALPYLSNLVVIQRLLALSWTWALVSARPLASSTIGMELEFDILRIIFADCRFLQARLGDSFPNNHLLADRFAAWYIATLFPEFCSQPEHDRQLAEAALHGELQRQVLADGSGFEHATHYHEFGCEMVLAHFLLSRRNGRNDDATWSAALLRRMLSFQLDLGGPECRAAAVGNATEDPLFPLSADEGWATGAFRETYRALFDPTLSAAPADDRSVERAYWLLGGGLARSQPAAAHPRYAPYPHGGFYILSDSDQGSRLVFRTGPVPGERVMGGHMHADLLSVTLSLRGAAILVDPGTYSYRLQAHDAQHGADGWRAYFAGPQAHNGPSIAGVDPLGALAGDFRASQPATTAQVDSAHAAQPLRWVEAALSGEEHYNGLRRGVLHVSDRYWIVYDTRPAQRVVTAPSYRFQLAAECKPPACADADDSHIDLAGGALRLAWSAGLAPPRVLHGSLNPRGGWVSPGYGELAAAPQLVFDVTTDASAPRPTAFVLQGDATDRAERIECQCLDKRGYAFRIEGSSFEDVVLVVHDSTGPPVQAWGLTFAGAILWLRRNGEGWPVQVRWLAGRQLHCATSGMSLESDSAVDVVQFPAASQPPASPHASWPTGLTVCWPDAAHAPSPLNPTPEPSVEHRD